MNNRTFLLFHGIVYTAFAIALFIVPSFMWPMYGVEINDKYAYFLSQHTSIFLGGIAAISLLLRNIEHRETIQQLLKALVITNALGVIITGYAGVIGIFVGFGWSDPAFFTLLTILSVLQLKKHG